MAITPATSVVKISGTISMRMRLMNRSPTGLSQVSIQAVAASCPIVLAMTRPSTRPRTSATRTRCHSLIENHQRIAFLPLGRGLRRARTGNAH